jgi:formiminoglutamase
MFIEYSRLDVDNLTTIRLGETKLGQKIGVGCKFENTSSRYVLLGIKEDIGVRANFGQGGTHTVWDSFLKAFLNIQSTNKLSGEEIQVAGHLEFKNLEKLIPPNTKGESLGAFVEEIDAHVIEIIERIVTAGKIPIIVGGGHNNSYPNIWASSKGLYERGDIPFPTIGCINLDAHSDYRKTEWRHSGNGFRYAHIAQSLSKYAIIGLHENYNAQNILDEFKDDSHIDFTFWEDIFLREKLSFSSAVQRAIDFTKGLYVGIELDLDSIERVLSSAFTPSGISSSQVRQFIHQVGSIKKLAYLHICEGATQLENGQVDNSTGKLISYLVSDFVKENKVFFPVP